MSSDMNFYPTTADTNNLHISQQASEALAYPQYNWQPSPSNLAESQPRATELAHDVSGQNLQPGINDYTSEAFRCEDCKRGFAKQFELT